MKTLAELKKEFSNLFSTSPQTVAYAPGRLEILGNHTDYNQGVVLSAAVDRGTFFVVAPAPDSNNNSCKIHDLGHNDSAEFQLTDLANPRPGEWVNYIKGMIVELQRHGLSIPPFNAVLYSTVPLSAGMSSSAALEMAVGLALTELAGGHLSKLELAQAGQACENQYVGANTGLLDQITSLHGRADHLVYSDFRSLAVNNIPLPSNISLVVANSQVKHDLTDTYNQRRQRCEEAVTSLAEQEPGIQALRDISKEQLEKYRDNLSVTAYRRALHVVGENERVWKGIEALRHQDLATFGRFLFDSHDSSRYNFENSCPELDTLVELGKSLPGIIGARLSGGGFGGITVHLVEENQADNFSRRLATAWHSRTGQDLQTFICRAADGGQIL